MICFWNFWMKYTLSCIFIRHKQNLSLFYSVFFITPDCIFIFFVLRFAYDFISIDIINIWICVKRFIIEALRLTFCWNPSMAFWLLISLLCYRIDLFLQSEKLVFQQFGTLFIPLNNVKVLCYKLFILLHQS